jgi:hypothetical protein
MANINKLLQKMVEQPNGVRFEELRKVCEHFFGAARQSGTSHAVFRMPWVGDPRVYIQDANGKAKPYQVRQVLMAIKKLKGENHEL